MASLNNFNSPSTLVTGATSQIGRFLLPRLQMTGFKIFAISRQLPPLSPDGILWQQSDLLYTSSLPPTSSLFHLAPLPLLPDVLQQLPPTSPLTRIIAFSSTSCLTKADSPDAKERAIAQQLHTAEQAVITWCQNHHVAYTLFRPTLIYGCGQDKNVTFIARFIRRFGFFPILGNGNGLRQPVHADDLAMACIQAYFSPLTVNRVYNLSGGQTLSYRAMVEAIFHQVGKKPRILSIPLPLFKFLLRSFNWLPALPSISETMVIRMNQDLCFDHSAAYRDFAYQPRTFSNSIVENSFTKDL
jgi:nucleoside-diphosphate-sugar epimerase